MKSKFLNRRELLVLGLPFLLIGLGAVLLTAREKKRIARESGPWRLVVTDAHAIALTPQEAWQGYDLKYRLNYELQGKFPSDTKLGGNITWVNPDKTYLSVTGKNGKIQQFRGEMFLKDTYQIPYSPAPLKFITTRDYPQSAIYSTVLIDRDAFPAGEAIFQLSTQLESWDSKNTDLKTRPAIWSNRIDEDLKPLQVNQATPKLISSSTSLVAPLTSEYLIAMNEADFNMDTAMHNVTTIWDKNGFTSGEKYDSAIFLNSRFEDKNKREVALPTQNKTQENKSFHTFRGVLNQDPMTWDYYTDVAINLHSIPKSRGAIYWCSHMSIADSWPATFRIEVRPEWLCRPTKNLKIESVEVGGDFNIVSVNLQYSGTKQVEFERKGSGRTYYSQLAVDNRTNYQPVKEGHERLISSWSEHLELDKKPFFFNIPKRDGDYPSQICKVLNVADLGDGHYRIVYDVNHPKRKGAKFKAEVGIEGDGFLEIEADLK